MYDCPSNCTTSGTSGMSWTAALIIARTVTDSSRKLVCTHFRSINQSACAGAREREREKEREGGGVRSNARENTREVSGRRAASTRLTDKRGTRVVPVDGVCNAHVAQTTNPHETGGRDALPLHTTTTTTRRDRNRVITATLALATTSFAHHPCDARPTHSPNALVYWISIGSESAIFQR
jgi:hypothetical protein